MAQVGSLLSSLMSDRKGGNLVPHSCLRFSCSQKVALRDPYSSWPQESPESAQEVKAGGSCIDLQKKIDLSAHEVKLSNSDLNQGMFGIVGKVSSKSFDLTRGCYNA